MITSYCDLESLEKIISNSPINILEDDERELLRHKLDFSDLILKNTVVKINLSAEEINNKISNPIIKILLKGGRLASAKDLFLLLDQNNEVLFFNSISDPVCFILLANLPLKKINKYTDYSGFHCFSDNSDLSVLMDENVKIFKKTNVSVNWEFANSFLNPHHSIIIADPYLFKDDTKQSLLSLINSVTSKRLKRDYSITLIGSSRRSNLNLDEEGIRIKMSEIETEIKTCMPQVQVNFEFFIYNNDEFHDRYIITNNACIFSGYGLDIIKNNLVKKDGTWIAMKPFKQMTIEGVKGKFFFEIMLDKLSMMKSWKGTSLSKNPLFMT